MKRERTVLKGCERRILQIKSPKSELFEEAYFVLKPQTNEVSDADMVKEAERLLKNMTVKKRRFPTVFSLDDLWIFLAGVLLSVVILAIGALFF